MMNRWLDRGADGFRMDVISLLAKDPQLPDGTGSGYMFSPKYFAFQPRLHDYLREMRRECFDGRDCMCVGETSFVTTQNTGSVVDDGRELDMLFQFDVMDMDSGETKWDARPFDLMRFKQIISAWQAAIGWNTLFWGNHDQPRPCLPVWLYADRDAAKAERYMSCHCHVSPERNPVSVSG